MRASFGWQLPRQNQSYQFAVAGQPIAEEQLGPGDLIFYEGTYTVPDARPKPWNILHVEVYVGPGEQSIGSRHKQRIQVHNSYRFESKLWTLDRYHFRSLDAWMLGRPPRFAIDGAGAKFAIRSGDQML